MNLRPARLLVPVLVLSAITVTAVIPGAGANPIDDKKAQAAQLQTQLDAQGEKIGALGEQIHEAEFKLQDAEKNIAASETALKAAQAEDARLRKIMRERAALLYKTGGNTSVDLLDSGSLRDLAARNKYGAAAAQRDTDVVHDLQDAQDKLAAQEAEARQAREAAANEQKNLSAMRQSFQTQEAALEKKLNSANAELQQMIKADREAKAAAALRQAQEAAARAQARTTTTGGGGGGGGKLNRDTGVAPGYVPAPSPGAAAAVAFAVAQLGKPYVYAGAGPDVWDCSGLTMVAWAQGGVRMPHGAIAQGQMFPRVSQADAQPGDLLIFRGGAHVGMYVGGGTMINAPHTGDVVRYAPAFRSDLTAIVRPG